MINTSRGINWASGIFLITYQVLLLITFPFYLYYHPPGIGLIIFTLILWIMTGISITGGYHRYFAHRAFRTKPWIEAILVFFGTMSAQGSVLRWSYDHRLHHAHVDTDDDPYSINKGFWYAHFLWILEKPRPIEKKLVPDLLKNPLLVFQDNYYSPLMAATNLSMFLLAGWIFNDWIGALFLTLFGRMFMLHHFTWFINSLAHTWGDKPFSEEQSAVDNYVISLVTFGEGYHNYHHTYANDYRNGIRWYHFDPTKWIVWTLSKLGLAYDLKRMDQFTVKKRMVLERKNLLLTSISDHWQEKKDELEKVIQELSEQMLQKITEFKELMDAYKQVDRKETDKELVVKLKSDIKRVKKSLKSDWKVWDNLSQAILHFKPIPAK